MRKKRHILQEHKCIPYWLIFTAVLITLFHTSEIAALGIEFTNYNAIDFGSVNLKGGITIIDDIPYDGLVIRCTAGPNTPGWTLKVKLDEPLTHTDNPASIIPRTNFKWYGESTSDSTNNSLITTHEDFAYEKTVYIGAALEDQTDITLKFELMLTRDLQWGTYTTRFTDIVFTLTE